MNMKITIMREMNFAVDKATGAGMEGLWRKMHCFSMFNSSTSGRRTKPCLPSCVCEFAMQTP